MACRRATGSEGGREHPSACRPCCDRSRRGRCNDDGFRRLGLDLSTLFDVVRRMLHGSDVEMEQTFTQVSARPFGPSLEVRLYERNLAIDSEGRTCAAPVSFVHGEAGLKSLTNPVDQQCIDRRQTTIH